MTPSSLLLILICFVLSAVYSGAETGSYMINRIRLNHRLQRRHHAARVLSWVLRDSHMFVFTMLCGQNVAVYLLTTTVTGLYITGGIGGDGNQTLLGVIPWSAEMAATLTLMLPMFLFGEVGPKNLFRKKSDLLMYRFAGLMRISTILFYPFTFILKHLFHLITPNAHEEVGRKLHHLSSDGLKEHFSTGAKEGILSSDQSRMIDNATSMHNTPVRQLMEPLKNIPSLHKDATVADLKQLVARKKTAYAILIHQHKAVGMISLFSIIKRRLPDDQPLLPYAGDILKLEEDRNIKSAFFRLRRNPHHCAVIINTRQHPVGFIRMDDIARFIIG